MSEGKARFVARETTLEQELADKDPKAVGSGDSSSCTRRAADPATYGLIDAFDE